MNELDTEFSTIDAIIDDETTQKLCHMYVKRMMHPASLMLFEELLSGGGNVQYALYRAVINQSVLTALIEDMDESVHPITPFNI